VDINKLDVSVFDDEIKNVSLGQFSEEIANFIIDKKPDFKGRLKPNKDILFWSSRVKHTERHKKDFTTEEEFDKCVEDIP
jgi:hypothetical protein